MSLSATLRQPKADEYGRVGGPWDGPSLDELLTAGPVPGAPALVDGALRLTRGELDLLAFQLAGGLRAAGIGRGDAVAWQLANRHESVVLYRACWRLGAVAVPLHHRLGPADVSALVDLLEPAVVLGATDLPAASLPGAVHVGGSSWETLLSGPEAPRATVDGADVAAVLFTAGSTGAPKGVLHTHRALAHKAASMGPVHGLGVDDVVLMPAPLAHVSGLLNGILVPAAADFTCVLMERWDPDDALALIEREGVTFMVGPPTFFTALLDAPGFAPERVATLRLVSSGGAGVTEAFVRRAEAGLGAVVKRTYGSTEAPTVATTPATQHGDDVRWRTDGRPVGDVELAVFEPGGHAAPATGSVGELAIRGPELFAGYLDAADTEAATCGGWFMTGDLATIDADGWLTIVGRSKDVVIRGGENISTAEVEAVLEEHPAVHAAVAIGYPDDRLGERVAAFVVVDGPFDVAAAAAWFEERGVARFKSPERIEVVAELPLLPAGKPDRVALAERLAQG